MRYYRNFNIVEFTKNRREGKKINLEYFFKFYGKLGFKSWLHYYVVYMEILIRKVELFPLVSFV